MRISINQAQIGRSPGLGDSVMSPTLSGGPQKKDLEALEPPYFKTLK
jgi:hypothetical protein